MSKLGIIKFCMESVLSYLLLFLLPLEWNQRFLLFIFWMIMQFMAGRYRHKALLIWDEMRMMMLSFLTTWIVGILILPWNHGIPWVQIGWVTLYIICDGIGCLLINRYAHLWFWKWTKHNVLIVGSGKDACQLEDVCRHNRFSLMDVQGFIDITKDPYFESVPEFTIEQRKPVWDFSETERVVRDRKIDTILVAVPSLSRSDLKYLYKRITPLAENIQFMPRTEGQINFASQINDFDGLLLISTSKGRMNPWQRVIKRTVDLIGCIPGMLLLAPLTAYVYISNRRTGDRGPLFFVQERIGKNGKLFKMYKYRSMVENADEILEQILKEDGEMAHEYRTMKKLKHDPRITKAGQFLRKTGLDEFPQFINVLKGEMSLVGPRPYLPREKAEMGSEYQEIIKAKPGITGMWQTHGRSDLTFDERLELDHYYNHNWNLWLDFTIFVKTIKSILRDEENGAY